MLHAGCIPMLATKPPDKTPTATCPLTSGHSSSWSTAHDTITCMLGGGIVWQSQQLWELTGAAVRTGIWTAQGAGGVAGGALEVCTAPGAAHWNAAVEVEVAFNRRDFALCADAYTQDCH